MIKYVCDWCMAELPCNQISQVMIKNVYNKKATLHICRECGALHMPEWLQANLSWTAKLWRQRAQR